MRENARTENARTRRRSSLGLGPVFPRFRAQDVPDDRLALLLNLAHRAGTVSNLQASRWIVVRSEAAKKHLESASHIEAPLSSAPVVLICLADTQAWKSAPQRLQEMIASRDITEEQGHEILRQVQEYYSSSPDNARQAAMVSAQAAVQQVLLGAGSCGLSAYEVTEFDEIRIKTHFHIPDHFVVAGLLPVGYGEEAPAQPTFKPASRTLIYQEKFGKVLNP